MNKKIAIIIPTIHRDELLIRTLRSIFKVREPSWQILVIDQNKQEDDSEEKLYYYQQPPNHLTVIRTDYDIGISASRNLGVKFAKENKIPYCFITADSIEFTESTSGISKLAQQMNNTIMGEPLFTMASYDLIGLDLKNRRVGWEAKLKLIENRHFELDFIDKNPEDYFPFVFTCDIVRNFFLATTKSLFQVKWDENLKACEHEDFFIRYKRTGFKVGWLDFLSGKYIGTREGTYGKLREKNINECREILKKKYNLKGWVQYKHLERAKEVL